MEFLKKLFNKVTNNVTEAVAAKSITKAVNELDLSDVIKFYNKIGEMYQVICNTMGTGIAATEIGLKDNSKDIGKVGAKFAPSVKTLGETLKQLSDNVKDVVKVYEDNKDDVKDIIHDIKWTIQVATENSAEKVNEIYEELTDTSDKFIEKFVPAKDEEPATE